MAAGRPVLCSNTTSLPEVAGGAALLFDPRVPAEIADAIARIAKDPDLRRELVAKAPGAWLRSADRKKWPPAT
jgi:glycosyltransferase involved in cell wall biosynthesis